jgi:uncharacterized protein (DUF1015 family)
LVDIRPFRAIAYSEKAGALEDLITQPYDKIDLQMQREYYSKSPFNYCRLILPIEDNKYQIADKRVSHWLAEGILKKESQPAIFVSRQEFALDGKIFQRTGIIAALRLYSYNENMVFPHEATYKAPKADRLNMLRTVQKDLEPVFLMYQDPEGRTSNFMELAAQSQPIIEVTDALGVKHTVWKVNDPEEISKLQSIFSNKTLVINDGHHRYESALAYRDEMRVKSNGSEDLAFNFHMSYLVPVQEEGLVVLPTHRLLKDYTLTDDLIHAFKFFFDVVDVVPEIGALEKFLKDHINEHSFGVYDGSRAFGLVLKHDKAVYDFVNEHVSKETKVFDVIILKDIVFKFILRTGELSMDESILYVRWTKTAFEKVDQGEASIAFLVNPISAKTIAEIAVQHELLPEKSTDFYPKLVSGFLMMDISSDQEI